MSLLVTGSIAEAAAQSLKGRAIWAGPRVAGRTEESVNEFADKLVRGKINMVVMMVKGTGGDIYWPSEKFASAVREGYQDFDFPAVLAEACHKRDIQVHAWFCDFPEGTDSTVVKEHPEWAMLSPEGKKTNEEILRGRNYGMVWMCPARRPGYTDQWLVPMIEEFAARYDFDGIHHDYVRYPGDLAPDTYCFCDYCLEENPRYAYLQSESHREKPFYPKFDRPHLEAHWEPSPRALPLNWDSMQREDKSRFLLSGGYFPGGNNDLDYFFYEYRIHWIQEFVRIAHAAARKSKPDMELSAAVFKNPVHSGRFIGQDWRNFGGYVHYAMPMDYRDHYPGDFETHLDILEESIHRQKEWARDIDHLWIGIIHGQLYREEREPFSKIWTLVRNRASQEEFRTEMLPYATHLKSTAPELFAAIEDYTQEGADADEAFRAIRDSMRGASRSGQSTPPEKFFRTLRRVRETGVEGIVIFNASAMDRADLWDELGEIFAE